MKVLLVFSLVILSALNSSAESLSISGRGEAPYTNPIGKPDKQVVAAARKEAIYNAVDRRLEGQSDALREQFNKFGKTLTAEEYEAKGIVTESPKTTVLPYDAKARKVTVLFEGKLDLQALRDRLNAISSVEGGTDVVLSKVAAMVFFTVRETTENFVFDDKKVTKTKQFDSVEGDAAATVSGKSNSLAAKGSASGVRETISSVESGVAQRTDKQKFALDAPSRDAFGSGMQAVFTAKGFRKIKDGSMLDVSKELDEAFGSGEGPSAALKRKMVKEVRENMPNVRYIVVGTVDFPIPTKDKDTGLPLFNGRVTGYVWEIDEDGGLPDVIAALEPIDKSQSAKTQQEAKARVITIIAENAAKEIISKLRNKAAL